MLPTQFYRTGKVRVVCRIRAASIARSMGQGVHPKIVSEMLGHSQVSITLDPYSHVTPTMQKDAAMALDEALSA